MSDRSSPADALTAVILLLFRVNNAALVWGDRLVQPFGLTSARWQVLGAIAHADAPRPVAWLARDLGANRQNVQRLVNELAAEGLVAFEANPLHKRAQLVVMTDAGRKVYGEAVRAWEAAASELAAGVAPEDLETTLRALGALRDRLKGTGPESDEEA